VSCRVRSRKSCTTWRRIASPLEAIEDRGDAAGGEAEQAGQGGGGQRADLADDVQGAHVGPVEGVPVSGHLVEAVDLRAQGAEAGGDLAGQHSRH
jgi:hypothetical protein